MNKPFQCEECESSFGLRHHLERHQRTVHEKLKPFQCVECPKSFGTQENFTAHIGRIHEGFRPHACQHCNEKFADKSDLRKHSVLHTRAEGFECPVCRVKIATKVGLAVHVNRRHSAKGSSGLKRKPTIQPNATCTLPSKRIKTEPPAKEGTNDEDVEQLPTNAEGTDAPNRDPKSERGTQAGALEASVKREDVVIEGFPPLAHRLRTTVKFKTSSGRVRMAEDQPASMSYGEFRKLFGIPIDAPKRIDFKKSADEWIVAVDDSMKLPLFDGCIVAETCTDF